MAEKNLEWMFNKRSPVGDVGVELEVEGIKLSSTGGTYNRGTYFNTWPQVTGWSIKTDGSLRNGMEYVTRTPIPIDKLETKVNALVTALKDKVTGDSIRTSCHVHVNALPLTPLELVNAMTSFWLVEDIISDYWGEERKGNGYCARLSDNPGHLATVINAIRGHGLMGMGEMGSVNRYASLNILALPRHGSIEFRGMRGSVDTAAIMGWAKTAHHIMHNASKRYKTPLHVFENYLNTSNQVDFLKKIVGPHIADKLDFSEERLEKITENAINLADFAYMHLPTGTWEKWEEAVIKERSKRIESQTAGVSSTTASPSLDYWDIQVGGSGGAEPTIFTPAQIMARTAAMFTRR